MGYRAACPPEELMTQGRTPAVIDHRAAGLDAPAL